jgi:thiamine kinase-like enzyme
VRAVKPATIQRIADLGFWTRPFEVEPLDGGLSNESYTVTSGGQRHVVRFGDDYPFHHVSRAHEVMVARAAHAAGLAPKVVHAAPGVMVSEFIDGTTYGPEDVKANAPRVVDLVRRFHQELPRHLTGPVQFFWVFHVIRDYARMLQAVGFRMASDLPRFLALAEELESAQTPLPIIFGHNDLLPTNFIDDGERLWLVDFEYAGFSTAMFDLAGVASNAGFDIDESTALLERYFQAPQSPALLRAHAAMKCASLLREAMWSMVSEHYLDAPGADYPTYTAENLERLALALEAYRSGSGRVAS